MLVQRFMALLQLLPTVNAAANKSIEFISFINCQQQLAAGRGHSQVSIGQREGSRVLPIRIRIRIPNQIPMPSQPGDYRLETNHCPI